MPGGKCIALKIINIVVVANFVFSVCGALQRTRIIMPEHFAGL